MSCNEVAELNRIAESILSGQKLALNTKDAVTIKNAANIIAALRSPALAETREQTLADALRTLVRIAADDLPCEYGGNATEPDHCERCSAIIAGRAALSSTAAPPESRPRNGVAHCPCLEVCLGGHPICDAAAPSEGETAPELRERIARELHRQDVEDSNREDAEEGLPPYQADDLWPAADQGLYLARADRILALPEMRPSSAPTEPGEVQP